MSLGEQKLLRKRTVIIAHASVVSVVCESRFPTI